MSKRSGGSSEEGRGKSGLGKRVRAKQIVALAVPIFFLLSAVSPALASSPSVDTSESTSEQIKEDLYAYAASNKEIRIINTGPVKVKVSAIVRKQGSSSYVYENVSEDSSNPPYISPDRMIYPNERATITLQKAINQGQANEIAVLTSRGLLHRVEATVISGRTAPGAPVTATVASTPRTFSTKAGCDSGRFQIIIPFKELGPGPHHFKVVAGDRNHNGVLDKGEGEEGYAAKVWPPEARGATTAEEIAEGGIRLKQGEVNSVGRNLSLRFKPIVLKLSVKNAKPGYRSWKYYDYQFDDDEYKVEEKIKHEFNRWKKPGRVIAKVKKQHGFKGKVTFAPSGDGLEFEFEKEVEFDAGESSEKVKIKAEFKGAPEGRKKFRKVKKVKLQIKAQAINPFGCPRKEEKVKPQDKGVEFSWDDWQDLKDEWTEEFDISQLQSQMKELGWTESTSTKVGVSVVGNGGNEKYRFRKRKFYSYKNLERGLEPITKTVEISKKNFDDEIRVGVSADSGLSPSLSPSSTLDLSESRTLELTVKPDLTASERKGLKDGEEITKTVTVHAWDPNPPENVSEPIDIEKSFDVTFKAKDKPSKEPNVLNQWKEWFDLDTSGHRFTGKWNKSVSGHKIKTEKKNGKYIKENFEEYSYSLQDWQTASIPITVEGHNFDGKVNLDVKADSGLKASLRDSSLDVHSKVSTVMDVTPNEALLFEGWESGTDGWSNHGGRTTWRAHSGSRGLHLTGKESITREIDLSRASGVAISYWEKGWSFDGPANSCETARLDFYDGSVWHNDLLHSQKDHFNWRKRSFKVPNSWLSSNNKIRFKFEDHSCDGCCGGDHWVIDDIKAAGNGSSRANTTSLKHVKVYARDANPPGRTTLLTEGWENGNADSWNKDFKRKSRGGEDPDSGVSGKAQAHSGSYVMYIHNANRIQRTIDLTDVPASKTVKVTWWWKARSCEGGNGVNFMVNGKKVVSEDTRNTGWRKESYDLSSYAGKKITIGFEGEVGPWDYLSVDDVKVTYGVGAIDREKLADITIMVPPKGPESKKVNDWQEWFNLNTSGHRFEGKWENKVSGHRVETERKNGKYHKKKFEEYSYSLRDWQTASIPISVEGLGTKGRDFDGKVKLSVDADPGLNVSLSNPTLDVHSKVGTDLKVTPTVSPSKGKTLMKNVKVYARDANPPEGAGAIERKKLADIAIAVPSPPPKEKKVNQWKEWFDLSVADKINAWNKWKSDSYSTGWSTVSSEEKTQTKEFRFEDYDGWHDAYNAAAQWAGKGDKVTTKIKLTGYIRDLWPGYSYKENLEGTPQYINLPSSDYEPEVKEVRKKRTVVKWAEEKSKKYETEHAAAIKYAELINANTDALKDWKDPVYTNIKMENYTDKNEPIEWGAAWWEKKWHFEGYDTKAEANRALQAVKNVPEYAPVEYYGEDMYPDNYKAKWYTLEHHGGNTTYETKKAAKKARRYNRKWNSSTLYNEEIVSVPEYKTQYKAEWTTTKHHSKTYDTKSKAKDKRDATGGSMSSYVADRDYKVEWTTTKHHSKNYDSWRDAYQKKKATNGSISRYVADRDYKIRWYDSTHHKEWRGGWDYRWFNSKGKAKRWGDYRGSRCVDREYKAKKKVTETKTKWFDSYSRGRNWGDDYKSSRCADREYKAKKKVTETKTKYVGSSWWARYYSRYRGWNRAGRTCTNRKYKAERTSTTTKTKWFNSRSKARRKGRVVDSKCTNHRTKCTNHKRVCTNRKRKCTSHSLRHKCTGFSWFGHCYWGHWTWKWVCTNHKKVCTNHKRKCTNHKRVCTNHKYKARWTEKSTKTKWFNSRWKARRWGDYKGSKCTNYKYKLTKDVTKTKTKWFNSYSQARRWGDYKGSRCVDHEYKFKKKVTKTKTRWFNSYSQARRWGDYKGSRCVDHEYKARKWDPHDHKVWVGGYRSRWFDDKNDHRGRVVAQKVTDYDYKVEWTTTQHHSATYDDWSTANRVRRYTNGSVSSFVADRDYKVKWTTTEPKSKWFDSYSKALAKSGPTDLVIESRQKKVDTDYKYKWDTRSYGSDTFMFKSDAKDAATKGDRHEVSVKPVHWQVEYYEKNWKYKDGFKSESAAEDVYQNNILRHGGYTYATDWGVDWTVSWDAPHEKKYANSNDAWNKYYALDGKDGIENLDIESKKVSVGYKAKRYGVVEKQEKTTYFYSWKKPWYQTSTPEVSISAEGKGTKGHAFTGDVELDVVDSSNGYLKGWLNDGRIGSNGHDASTLRFGGKTVSYNGTPYEVAPLSGTQWVKIRARDANGSLTRTKKVRLDIGTKGHKAPGPIRKTRYRFSGTGAPVFTADLTKKEIKYEEKARLFGLVPAGLKLSESPPKIIITRGDVKKTIYAIGGIKGKSAWASLMPKRVPFEVVIHLKSMQTGRTQELRFTLNPKGELMPKAKYQ